MVSLNSVVRYLNKEINIKSAPDDSSRNGLQVRGRSDVKKIGFAVDACIETFEKAKKQDCDMVVVHHGQLWKGFKYPNEWKEKRINYLKKYGISLYASHLPLDKNGKFGNNIELAKILDLKNIKPFGIYHGYSIGYQGRYETSVSIKYITNKLNHALKTKCYTLPFGKKSIKTIGIVSGGGSSALAESIEKKLDCFITGELGHSLYHYIKENKINVITAGHYATETVGVKALMPIVKERFGVETVFIDVPTNL